MVSTFDTVEQAVKALKKRGYEECSSESDIHRTFVMKRLDVGPDYSSETLYLHYAEVELIKGEVVITEWVDIQPWG